MHTVTSRFIIVASALVCLFSPWLASAQEATQAAEINQLKQQIAEQNRRIAQLEKQVQFLMAARSQRVVTQQPRPQTSGAPASASTNRAPGQPVSSATENSSIASSSAPGAATTKQNEAAAKTSPNPPTAISRQPEAKIKIAGIDVGGDVYLFQYVPFGVSGAQPRFELYAFSAKLRSQRGPWNFYMDYRFRTTKLRSFFPGSTWLQEGYVGYQTRYGEFKAGSFYRHVGLVWDDSFFGNIQYFDGLKLDPEFGVGFEGTHKISNHLSTEYSVQYFTTDARINGSLPGRDFVSDPGAHAKNDGTFRFAPVWRFNPDLSLTVGGSFARGTIERDGGPNNTRWQVAGDATLQWRGLLTYAEVLNQRVDGIVIAPPQNATYTLFGARWARGRFQPRFNFSAANYHAFNPRREYILQPGITINMYDGFSFLYEFDYWKETSVPNPFLLDQSLNFVLLYHF